MPVIEDESVVQSIACPDGRIGGNRSLAYLAAASQVQRAPYCRGLSCRHAPCVGCQPTACIDRQLVVMDVRRAGQIEERMMCQVDHGWLVGYGTVVDVQVRSIEPESGFDPQVTWKSIFPILARQGEVDAAIDGPACPQAAAESTRSAVGNDAVRPGCELVAPAVEREAAIADAAGETPDDAREAGIAFVVGQRRQVADNVFNPAITIRRPDFVEDAAKVQDSDLDSTAADRIGPYWLSGRQGTERTGLDIAPMRLRARHRQNAEGRLECFRKLTHIFPLLSSA